MQDLKQVEAQLDDSQRRYYGPGFPWLKARYGRIIGNVIKGPVLDIGCGAGVVCCELQQRGFDIVGLDYSPKILVRARSRSNGIKYIEGRAENIPFPDHHFNTIIMTEMLEHVEDEQKAIAEADRVAKHKAAIIISVPNGGALSKIHVRLFDSNSLKQLLPWKIIEFDIFGEWIWAKCVKEG